MDYYYTTPVKQCPPLIRTLSSPNFTSPLGRARSNSNVGLNGNVHVPGLHGGHAMHSSSNSSSSNGHYRRDSVSSLASSIESFPLTPMSEDFVAPDLLFRSTSSSGRPRSSTAGSSSSQFHPYFPTYNSSSNTNNSIKMARRATHTGSSDEVPKLACNPYYTPADYPPQVHTPQRRSNTHSRSSSLAHSQTPLGYAIGGTPMAVQRSHSQTALSSPLSQTSPSHLNAMVNLQAQMAHHQMNNPNKDALPLIVSSMDKTHICPHCSKRFKRLEHVKRHERSHTQEKPFACSVSGCGRYFSRSDNLKAHEKTHYKKGRNWKIMCKKMGSGDYDGLSERDGTVDEIKVNQDEEFGSQDQSPELLPIDKLTLVPGHHGFDELYVF